jgi:CDP-4-dehydro-6-deoxyglucose reductase, E1
MDFNQNKNLRKKISHLVKKYSDLQFKKRKFVPGKTVIPPTGKVIGDLEIQNMVEASLDGWLTAGRFNKKFEKKLAEFIGIKQLITVNSGSSANLVAFSALTSSKLKDRAIKPFDEVITVAAGFPTTINPIVQCGAIPVFVDVKIPSYNIDETLIEEAITPKTKAIMVAHTLGNPFNLKAVKSICEKHNLWLIEDSCDALGSKYDGKTVGTFGDIATLSFYPAHTITMGEGGAVFTNSIKLKMIAQSFRDWGRDCYCEPGKENTCGIRFDRKMGKLTKGYDHKYIFSHAGYNMKITDMQAACGLAQVSRLKEFIKIRKSNFKYIYNNLKSHEEFLILPKATENSDPAWFGFPITLKDNLSITRNQLLRHLDSKKIGFRLLFAGDVTKQPYMLEKKFRIVGTLKNTTTIMNNTFWIGLYPGLRHKELDFVIDQIKKFVR